MRISDWSSDVCSSDLTLRELERILYFESYVVIEPGLTDLKERQTLSEEEYLDKQEEFGEDAFTAKIGAEAMKDMLGALDIAAERDRLRQELRETTSEAKRKKDPQSTHLKYSH